MLTKSLPRPALAKHRQYMWGTRIPFSAFYLSLKTGRPPTASYNIITPCGSRIRDHVPLRNCRLWKIKEGPPSLAVISTCPHSGPRVLVLATGSPSNPLSPSSITVCVECSFLRSPSQAPYGTLWRTGLFGVRQKGGLPGPPPRSPSPRTPRCPGGHTEGGSIVTNVPGAAPANSSAVHNSIVLLSFRSARSLFCFPGAIVLESRQGGCRNRDSDSRLQSQTGSFRTGSTGANSHGRSSSSRVQID
jgi:hypothetical protein